MVFCPSCKSPVSADERPVIRRHGGCTPCYLKALPPLEEQHALADVLSPDQPAGRETTGNAGGPVSR